MNGIAIIEPSERFTIQEPTAPVGTQHDSNRPESSEVALTAVEESSKKEKSNSQCILRINIRQLEPTLGIAVPRINQSDQFLERILGVPLFAEEGYLAFAHGLMALALILGVVVRVRRVGTTKTSKKAKKKVVIIRHRSLIILSLFHKMPSKQARIPSPSHKPQEWAPQRRQATTYPKNCFFDGCVPRKGVWGTH